MQTFRLSWLLIALWSLNVTIVAAELPVPALESRVTDLAGLLTADQQQQLEQQLTSLEQSKGSQIAVLIVPTTKPETIDQYSIRVASAWKLGRKDVDDGLLLLIAVNDRTMRIEVGYGLEGAVPDAIAKRVIAEIITPYFKQQQYYQGIAAGVQRLIGLVNGEPLPEPDRNNNNAESDLGSLLMMVVFALFIGGNFINAIFGRLLGAGVTSTIVTVLIWLVMGSLLTAILIGVGVLIFSLLRPGMNGVSSGRHGDGGFGSGGFGGGGFGGGGFGGGGGGFGGGGASGGW